MPAPTVDILSSSSSAPVPSLVIKLTRGAFVKLGTLVAANTAVAFSVPEPTYWNQGFLNIQVVGTAGTTPTLEISIDGGGTFAPVAPTTSLTLITALTGDTACTAFYQFNCSGMGGALFKFGYTGAGVPAAAIWALVG
jgi:hypothetical protein